MVAEELVNLVERGIVHVYDVMLVGKDADGSTYMVDLAESSGQAGSFADLSGVRSGILAEDDLIEVAGAMQPGTLAALIVLFAGIVSGAAAQAKPEGEMRWAMYVTLSPVWFDPGESVIGVSGHHNVPCRVADNLDCMIVRAGLRAVVALHPRLNHGSLGWPRPEALCLRQPWFLGPEP